MSKARDEYYKLKTDVFLCSHKGLVPAVENYILELEAENKKLIEDITDIGIEKIKLEAEKAELMDVIEKIKSLTKSKAVNNPLEQIYIISDITLQKHGVEI